MALFIGGKDTQPEIDALNAAIKPEYGLMVSHDKISKIINVAIADARFATVVNRWRKLVEKNHGVRVVSRARMFHFLTPQQALDYGRRDFHKIGKATGKLVLRTDGIEQKLLSDEQREQLRLSSREYHLTLDSIRKSSKAIAAPQPVRTDRLRIAK